MPLYIYIPVDDLVAVEACRRNIRGKWLQSTPLITTSAYMAPRI